MSNEIPEEIIEPADEMVQIDESQIERVEEKSIETLEPPKPKWWKKFKPGNKREVQLQSMQSGYQEVLGLVRSMRDNLDGQMESQKMLLEFMSELPGVADGLKNVGKATEQQKEMLTVIKGQMENNLEHNSAISGSMERFNDTLFTMDDTTRKILEGARASEDSLKDMLERSERRLVLLTTFLIIAILGVGGGLFYFIYNGDIDLNKIRSATNKPGDIEWVEGINPVEAEEAIIEGMTNVVEISEEPESVIPTDRVVEVENIFKDKEEIVPEDVEAQSTNTHSVVEPETDLEAKTEEPIVKPKRKKWFGLFGKEEVSAEEVVEISELNQLPESEGAIEASEEPVDPAEVESADPAEIEPVDEDPETDS